MPEHETAEMTALLRRLLTYPVDPAARDRLWRRIAADLAPPSREAAPAAEKHRGNT